MSKYRTQAEDALPPDLGRVISLAGKSLALASGSYVAASLPLQILPDVGLAFWLTSAVAFLACVHWGRSMAPAIFAGATLAQISADLPLSLALLSGLGHAAQAMLAAAMFRRSRAVASEAPGQFALGRFIIAAAAAGLLGATGEALVPAYFQGSALPQALIAVASSWLANTLGILLTLPLLLPFPSQVLIRRRLAEAAAFSILLLVVNQAVFSYPSSLPLAFLPLAFLAWAAIRFPPSAIALAVAALSLLAAWNTVAGRGPFSASQIHVAFLFVHLYTGTAAALGLALFRLSAGRQLLQERRQGERDNMPRQHQDTISGLYRELDKLRRMELEFARRERAFAQVQKLAQMGSWEWDLVSNTMTWSDEHYLLYGVSKDRFHVTPGAYRALIHDDDWARLQAAIDESTRSGKPFQLEHRIVRPDGTVRILAARGCVATDQSGRATRVFGTSQAISRESGSELPEAELHGRLVDICPSPMLLYRDGRIRFANPACARLFGAADPLQLLGQPLLQLLHPDFHKSLLRLLEHGQPAPLLEAKLLRIDGSQLDVEIEAGSMNDTEGAATLLTLHDITERKQSTQRMIYLAHYDSLTGLPNRTLFDQRLTHALSLAQRPGKSLEILFLDLDGFKCINDTLGHATGDLVLRETAARLQGILRESDTVARLGGDEFVVLVENIDEPHRGGTIAEKILRALEPPFLGAERALKVSASIGISSFPIDGTDAETLLKKADAAMYRAKDAGRCAYRYYSNEMNVHTAQRLLLQCALRQAIETEQLSLLYQPKVDVRTGRITGVEALLRWQHPALGAVPPEIFIPVAEETGLIHRLGNWALREACRQNKAWQEQGPERLSVAVNLTPRQLAHEDMVDDIACILQETGLDPCYLELELTEEAVMRHPELALQKLNRLHAMGIKIVIDDFGTGYSSVLHLKRFPIRSVKIDRSFVQKMTENREDAVAARAIISLAHSMDCTVIGEGAETEQQFDFLRRHECDAVQGFYFSHPLSVDLFAQLLATQAPPAGSRLH